jgi:Rod binding domain-containing protein
MIPTLAALTGSNQPQVDPGTPQPRLVKAAHEFEAQMMKELLKPLNSGTSITGEEEDSGSNGALGEYAQEALGRAMSDHGGLGIAHQIIQHLSGNQTGNQSRKDATSGNLVSNVVRADSKGIH